MRPYFRQGAGQLVLDSLATTAVISRDACPNFLASSSARAPMRVSAPRPGPAGGRRINDGGLVTR